MKKNTVSKSRFVSRFSKSKIVVLGTIACAFAAIVSFHGVQDSPDGYPGGEGETLASFENMPPIPRGYWIRKRPLPLDGEENVEMQIAYYDDPAIAAFPQIMPIYLSDEGNPILFYDDGSHGDTTSGDLIYTSQLQEDIPALIGGIQAREAILDAKLPFSVSKGRTAELVTSFEHFDADIFDAGGPTPVNALLIDPADCQSSILKQNSLFITDLSVVEDPARTFNVFTGLGNTTGAWTFGTMMKNAANTISTGVFAKEFIKSWLAHWTADETVNGQSVALRPLVIDYIIRPWLLKCDPNIENVSSGCSGGPVTLANWECKWDQISITEANLLKWAPFKLTAIVNRLDLVGNTSYARNVGSAGETRFIFSLIDPLTGKIPKTLRPPPSDLNNNIGPDDTTLTLDWAGMNVILEYENVQTNRCDIKKLAQDWLDLSSYTLPTTTGTNTNLNTALEYITNSVTNRVAKPGNANGSALARIRTNERILSTFNPTSRGDWDGMDWEFRQFELNATTHLIDQVPLFNTPVEGAMAFVDGLSTSSGNASINYAASNWVFQNVVRALEGTHVFPTSLLVGAGRVTGEFAHYSELGWNANTNVSYYRTLRQQYSLNTCQGCHNGETKTAFSQILPRGYGEPANYWQSTPDHFTGYIEVHIGQKENFGVTQVPGGGTVKNLLRPDGIRTIPVVSSFLTGRNYGGLIGTTYKWQDDLINQSEDATDITLNGRFYVNDPINSWSANGVSPTPSAINAMDWKFGYNDLEDRKDKLCQLVKKSCILPNPTFEGTSFAISKVLRIIQGTSYTPRPKGSH